MNLDAKTSTATTPPVTTMAPTGAVILVATVETFDDHQVAYFTDRVAALRWLVSKIDRREWEQWRDSLLSHEPDAHAAEPGVDDDAEVLAAWFGEHQSIERATYPGLASESWSVGVETSASIDAVILDDPASTWADR